MTTKTNKHIRPRSTPNSRHAFIESLGFAESTSVSYTSPVQQRSVAPSRLVSTAVTPATSVEEMWDTTELQADSMIDWAPVSVDSKGLNKRLRFKLVLAWLVVLTTLAAAAYWVLQAPGASGDRAAAQTRADALALDAALPAMLAATATLTPELDDAGLDLSSATASVDEASRELFASAGALADSDTAIRSNATSAATTALAAAGTLNTSAAYLGAVVPILTAPVLETDSNLVELADAASVFAAWQSKFDNVVAILPDAVFDPVSALLGQVGSNLGSIQSQYLDGLRLGDRAATLAAVRELERQLSQAWSVLLVETETLKATIAGDIASIEESLALVAG